MKKDHVKMLKNLNTVLFDDAGETPADVRRRLVAEGVDVKGMVTRIKTASGEAYRERLLADSRQANMEAARAKGKIFGNFVGHGREKLLELIHLATQGQFGEAVMARCRNQKPEELSEEDLQTLLQDIESTIES